jgi:hypothetical protein
MWFSSVIILVGKPSEDQNGLPDVLEGIRCTGAQISLVDEERSYIEATRSYIEATVLTRVVPIISAMEGVAYVRQVFNFHCAEPEAPEGDTVAAGGSKTEPRAA